MCIYIFGDEYIDAANIIEFSISKDLSFYRCTNLAINNQNTSNSLNMAADILFSH